MTQFSRYISLCCALLFNLSHCYCQDWTKQKPKSNDTAFATYSWEVHNDYHSAGGEIILTKNGRFKYSSYHPFTSDEYSDGSYIIHKNTLTLTSDFQTNNMKVDLSYVDTTTSDTSYTRLSFPKNQKGDVFYNAYYFLNNDTAFKNQFDPMLPFHRELLDSMKSLMIKFYDMDCGSTWIPIKSSNEFIRVTLLTDKNLDKGMRYKVINWKFRIVNNKLVAVKSNK